MRIPNLLCCSTNPVVWTWNSELRVVFDASRNQHGFVSGEHCLAEGDIALGLVLAPYVPGAIDTIGFVWERLANLSVLIAVKPAVLNSHENFSNLTPRRITHTIDWG